MPLPSDSCSNSFVVSFPEASCSRPLRGFVAIHAPGSSTGCLRHVSDPSRRALKVTWSNVLEQKRIENQDKFHYSEVNGARCKLEDYRNDPSPEGWDENRYHFQAKVAIGKSGATVHISTHNQSDWHSPTIGIEMENDSIDPFADLPRAIGHIASTKWFTMYVVAISTKMVCETMPRKC